MAQTIIMPKLGQTVEESTIVKWHKKIGDQVVKGDLLFEIETDKAVLEVESFFEGELLAIIVQEGQTVPVTEPVAFIGRPGEKIPDLPARPKKGPEPAASAETVKKAVASASTTPATASAATVASSAASATSVEVAPPPPRHSISPRARKLLRELPVNPVSIPASGVRVTEKDVNNFLESSGYNRLRLTPAARELALREKVDVLEVLKGADGRIGVEEIKTAVREKPQPLSAIRQVIARRMVESTTTIPCFFVTVAADVTDLLALRKEMKKAGKNYSLTDFIIRASAMALREFPTLNSVTDGKTARWRSRVNIGVAVSVPTGLLVPVIRDADIISMDQLRESSRQLAARARDGKLAPDDMTGGTFTISNMGMLDVDSFTAIINPGESAILAVASVNQIPVVRKGAVVIRSMMKMTLSSDHRLVDGAMAARFINKIRGLIEDVELWKNMMSL